jgi:hypothetical protein
MQNGGKRTASGIRHLASNAGYGSTSPRPCSPLLRNAEREKPPASDLRPPASGLRHPTINHQLSTRFVPSRSLCLQGAGPIKKIGP